MNKYAAVSADAILSDLAFMFSNINARVIRVRNMDGKPSPLKVEFFRDGVNLEIHFSARSNGAVGGSIQYITPHTSDENEIPPANTFTEVRKAFLRELDQVQNSLEKVNFQKQQELKQAEKEAFEASSAVTTIFQFTTKIIR
jgi:hypothetical protein